MKRAVELHCHNEVTETGIKASSEDLSGYSSVLLLFHFAGFSNVEAKDFFFSLLKKHCSAGNHSNCTTLYYMQLFTLMVDIVFCLLKFFWHHI